jgi:putative transposase
MQSLAPELPRIVLPRTRVNKGDIEKDRSFWRLRSFDLRTPERSEARFLVHAGWANGLERLNQEIKRRTRVVRIFPNTEACLRLVTALAVEQSEEWVTGRRYLDMSELKEYGQEEREAEVALMER